MNLRSTVASGVIALVMTISSASWAGPVEQQIQAQIQAFAEGDTSGSSVSLDADVFVPRFYQQRAYQAAWFGTAAGQDLVQEIHRGVSHGFLPSDFHLDILTDLQATAQRTGNAADIAAFEVVASDAAAKLLTYSIFGKVDPAKLDDDWNFERPVLKQDPAGVLNSYLAGDGFSALMGRILIDQPQYDQLVTALAAYREVAANGGWPHVVDREVLKPGMISEVVVALRYRLAAEHALNEGQILPNAPESGEDAAWVYDAGLVRDVKAFQARHGLEADGVIGPKSYQALNRTAQERVDQIRLSLERARWLMRDLDGDYVLVNIAGGRTYLVKEDGSTWITRSVTGSQYRKTPVFRDAIQYMEFNPTWTVPHSIFVKDKLAVIRKDPKYLERNNYVVRGADGKLVSPSQVNWSADNPGVTLVQQPGPTNALGLVKFMFPNKYAVYLHDTNNRDLFQRNERNLSSGCVRIEYPFEFASLLMEADTSWNEAKMQDILASKQTTRVTLPAPVPVLLTYWTAWLEDGAVQFREDIYARDTPILKALNR